MAKKLKKSNSKRKRPVGRPKTSYSKKARKRKDSMLTSQLKRYIAAIIMLLFGVIMLLSFFERAGTAGTYIFQVFNFVIGKTIFFVPVLLLAGALTTIKSKGKRIAAPATLILIFIISGVSGILAVRDVSALQGGWLGRLLSWPLLRYSSLAVSMVVFATFILIGLIIFWEFLPKKDKTKKKQEKELFEEDDALDEQDAPIGIVKKRPKFEIRPVEVSQKQPKAVPVVVLSKKELKVAKKQLKEAKSEEIIPIPALDGEYKMPPFELLDTSEEKPAGGDTEHNAIAIERTLQNFGISVEMSEVNVGPTVTQYTLKPAEGVKLSRLTALNNDLALALAAHPIRIEAPIPGKALVGIEVPNIKRAIVKMGNLIASPEFQESTPLSFALGKDVMGSPIWADLARMPHMLVAGATGSGKTICLNAIISSLIFRNSPKILRLILIDPKRVEFPIYDSLPHLLTPVILNARKAVNALNWLVGEMDRRFDVLREFGARDIHSYNSTLAKKPKKQKDFEQIPYIVLVIDELADLMMTKGKEVESSIVRLSQLARAVGIHLIVATQRPSVEVITGLIKANITSRVAFQVASQIDSRTILDTAGSEKLLGRGDMLFISSEFSRPKRIQGGFISSAEIKKIVNFIIKENAPEQMEDIDESSASIGEGTPSAPPVVMGGMGSVNEQDIMNFSAKDDLYDEAKEVVVQYQKASASLLQRRLQIGYARAARILDMLEEEGVVGPAEGSKPREIRIEPATVGGTHSINSVPARNASPARKAALSAAGGPDSSDSEDGSDDNPDDESDDGFVDASKVKFS